MLSHNETGGIGRNGSKVCLVVSRPFFVCDACRKKILRAKGGVLLKKSDGTMKPLFIFRPLGRREEGKKISTSTLHPPSQIKRKSNLPNIVAGPAAKKKHLPANQKS